MYDQGPKLGMRRKRNCAEDSATVKGKRPDFFLLSSRALLFKGEDKTSEADLQQALEEVSTKLKDWGAAVHMQCPRGAVGCPFGSQDKRIPPL